MMNKVIPPDLTIETARCKLRRPLVEDIPAIFAASRFTGFNDGMRWEPPATIAELDEPFRANSLAWDAGEVFTFTIADLSSNLLLGRIGLRQTKFTDVWDLGFWTHPEYQRRGYMTEATIAMMAFGFDRLDATKIEAGHALWNKGSQRVLEKVGMKFIEHVPHSFQKNGRWVESNKMMITKQEWQLLNFD